MFSEALGCSIRVARSSKVATGFEPPYDENVDLERVKRNERERGVVTSARGSAAGLILCVLDP